MTPYGRRPRRGPASVLALVAFSVAVFAAPAPAGAHPFGGPQSVAIVLERDHPEVVHLQWKVGAADDLTLLGVALGLLPQDRVMLDGAVDVRPSDAAVVGASTGLAAYLLKQITVASDGHRCTGSVGPSADLAEWGVTIEYSCPAPVGTATVVVRTLIDLNPAYRTEATGPDGQHAVYTSDEYSHDWALGGAPSSGGLRLGHAAVQISIVVGAVLFVAAAALLLFRRRERASLPHHPHIKERARQ